MTITTESEFTPESLRRYVDDIETLRMSILCDLDHAGSDPEAEQLVIMALAHLEQAKVAMNLAKLRQSRAVA